MVSMLKSDIGLWEDSDVYVLCSVTGCYIVVVALGSGDIEAKQNGIADMRIRNLFLNRC